MARALPMARMRRWVPPPPGINPSATSGWPKIAPSPATMMSQTIASSHPPPRAAALLQAAGYSPGHYLEKRKDYYDTLQQFWVAASHQGYVFRRIEGAGSAVYHVGGTSYLHRTLDNLSHWEYWPLNVHYFHLRLLDMPGCSRFESRFRDLRSLHVHVLTESPASFEAFVHRHVFNRPEITAVDCKTLLTRVKNRRGGARL